MADEQQVLGISIQGDTSQLEAEFNKLSKILSKNETDVSSLETKYLSLDALFKKMLGTLGSVSEGSNKVASEMKLVAESIQSAIGVISQFQNPMQALTQVLGEKYASAAQSMISQTGMTEAKIASIISKLLEYATATETLIAQKAILTASIQSELLAQGSLSESYNKSVEYLQRAIEYQGNFAEALREPENVIKRVEGALSTGTQALLNFGNAQVKSQEQSGSLTPILLLQTTSFGEIGKTVGATEAKLIEYAKTVEAGNVLLPKSSQLLLEYKAGISDTGLEAVKSAGYIGQLPPELSNVNAATSTSKKSAEELAAEFRKVSSDAYGVGVASKNVSDSMESTSQSVSSASSSTSIFSSALEFLKQKFSGASEFVNQTKTSFNDFTQSFQNASQRMTGFNASIDGAEPKLKSLKDSFDSNNAIVQMFQGTLSNLVGTISSFVQFQIAASLISGFTSAIRETIESAATFDQTLHSLKAITGATSIEMAGMGDVIKETSADSIYSIEAIGKGMQNMAQAGLSASESVNTIKAASNLAVGTLEKLENVTDLITSTMNSYGISAIESGRVSDILAIACNNSKLAIDGLRTSLNYVGVIAAQSGLSLEQTTASLMSLADRGMKASTIGTGFRQVLDKLIAPNEKLREAYQSHGISLEKISPLTVGYEEALKNLSIALYDSDTKTVNTAKAFELFGIRGAQAAAILIQAYTSGEWQESMNSFNESGTAARMAAEQMEGLQAKWDNLIAKASVVGASLGEGGLTRVLKGVVEALSGMLDAFQAFLNADFGMIGTVTEMIISFLATLTTAGISLFVVAIGLAITTTKTWTVVLGFAKTAMAEFLALLTTNPIFLLMAALVATGAAMVSYGNSVMDAIDKHNKLSIEAERLTNSISLFQKVLEKTQNDPVKLAANIERLKTEFPDLAKEISNVTGVIDISNLSYAQLTEAMAKVKTAKLHESLDETTKSFEKIAKGLVLVSNEFDINQGKMVETRVETDKTNATYALYVNYLKQIASQFIALGKDASTSAEEQKKAALSQLDIWVKVDTKREESRSKLTELIVKEFDKEAARLAATQQYYEKFTNKVSEFYTNLSLKEKAEVQSVLAEQEKAIDKYKKMAGDKALDASERAAEIYAITLLYENKAFAAISDLRKKEYETSEQKYEREKTLLERQMDNTSKSYAEQKKSADLYMEGSVKGIDDYQVKYAAALKSQEIATQTYHEQLRAYQVLTAKHATEIMQTELELLKTNISAQSSLLVGFEEEKFKLQEKELEAKSKVNTASLEFLTAQYNAAKEKGSLTEAMEQTHLENVKKNKIEEMKIVKESYDFYVSQGEYWIGKFKEQEDKRIGYLQENAEIAKKMIEEEYAYQETALKQNLEKSIAQISLKNKTENEIEKAKFDLQEQYYKSLATIIQDSIDKQLGLINEEYKEIENVTNQKYSVQTQYYNAIAGLNTTATQNVIQTEAQLTEQVALEIGKRSEAKKQETQVVQTESKAQSSIVIQEITNQGTTVQEELRKHGVAYVELTNTAKAEWEKQGGLVTEFGGKYYKFIEEQTTKTQTESQKQTAIITEELGKQTTEQSTQSKMREQIAKSEGVAKEAAIKDYVKRYGVYEQELTSASEIEQAKRDGRYVYYAGKHYQLIAEQTTAHKSQLQEITSAEEIELAKRQGVYVTFNDKHFKLLAEVTEETQKNATAQTKLEKEEADTRHANLIQSLKDKITALKGSLSEIEQVIADEKKLWNSLETEKQKAYKDISKLHESYAEQIRKVDQSLMTDSQKYNDDLKASKKALYDAERTLDEDYLAKAKSMISALSSSAISEDGKVVISAQSTVANKKSLLQSLEEVEKRVLEAKIDRFKKEQEQIQDTIKKYEDMQTKVVEQIKSLQTQEIKLNTEKFAASLDPVMQGIDSVISKIDSIRKDHPIEINTEGISTAIKAAETTINDFLGRLGTNFEEAKKLKIEVGGGQDSIPLEDYLTLSKGSLTAFETWVKDSVKPTVGIEFKGKTDTNAESKDLNQSIENVKSLAKTLSEGEGSLKETVKPEITVEAKMSGVQKDSTDISSGVEGIKTKIDEIPKKTKSKHDVEVTGVADLQAAIDKHSQLDGVHTNSYHTVHVKTVKSGGGDDDDGGDGSRTGGYIAARIGGFIQNLNLGGAFTGKVSGYGGGDIVNARLEPGEFVLRKEAVKNIGVNALRQWNNLNSEVQKSLNPQIISKNADSVFSGQLHTINLNIGGQDNIVYAPTDSLSNLTTALRRARMMRA